MIPAFFVPLRQLLYMAASLEWGYLRVTCRTKKAAANFAAAFDFS
jgi:hypothetical protein